MNATRRLDILAAIGGVLALAALIGTAHSYIGLMRGIGSNPAQARERILQRMRPSDLRADFEALSAPYARGEQSPEVIKELDQAAARYSGSARLQLHAGLLGSEDRRVQALERAVQLDPGNALPYYMLAYHATNAGKLDEAAAWLAKGNRQGKMTEYPFLEVLPGDLTSIDTELVNSSIRWPWYAKLRTIAMTQAKQAVRLHALGKTDEAENLLGEVRQMGLKVIKQDDAEIMDLLIGSALLHICQKYEGQVLPQTPERRAAAGKEKAWLTYLSAGGRYCSDKSMEDLVRTFARFAAPGMMVFTAGGAQGLLLFVCSIWWGILVLRSRRMAAVGPHNASTETAFLRSRLVRAYGVFLLMAGITTAAVVLSANLPNQCIWELVAAEVAPGLFAVAVLMTLIMAIKWYKRAYVSVENPRFWRHAPAEEKREIMRRLIGFQGGMIVMLALFGVLVCGYTQITMHALPWQFDRVMTGMRQSEKQYVKDLVAGKVKVPQKYIDEVKRMESKRGSK